VVYEGKYSQIFGNALFAVNSWITVKDRNATLASVCIKFHDDCVNEGANCPLYLGLSTNYVYFSKVDGSNKVISIYYQ